MGGPPDHAPKLDEETRARLLTGAGTALAARGIAGLRIQDIAREAKVSLRTFYEYYPSKEACLSELWAVLLDNLMDAVATSVQNGDTWQERTEAGAKTYLQAMAAAPGLTRAFLAEASSHGEQMVAGRRRAHNLFAARLISIVDQTREDYPELNLRPLTMTMAQVITGGLTELALAALEQGRTSELTELSPVAVELIWAVLNAPEMPSTSA